MPAERVADRLVELNVLEQVRLLRASPIVRDGAPAPLVHGWIFSLSDGLLKVLASGYPDGEAHAGESDAPRDTSRNGVLKAA